MTNKPASVEQLEELAGRVEQLSGPSKELDASIALVVGTAQLADGYTLEQVFGRECHAYAGTPYTASIDAAMTLVPEGWTFAALSQSDRRGWWCELRRGYQTSYDKSAFGNQLENTNAAIAITAAALRAQSLLNQEKPK